MAAFSRGLVTSHFLSTSRPQLTTCFTARPSTSWLEPLRLCRQSSSQIHIRCGGPRRQVVKEILKARIQQSRQHRASFAIASRTTAEPRPKLLRTFAHTLAEKGSTTLYEGPSIFWMRLSCISAGTFCLGYATYHYWSVLLSPPNLEVTWWVPHAFAVICIAMGGMGMYFFMGTAYIIRSIRAVPTSIVQQEMLQRLGPAAKTPMSRTVAATQSIAGSAQATQEVPTKKAESPKGLQMKVLKEAREAVQASKSPVVLEIQRSKVLPFGRPRSILALPEDVLLTMPMQHALQAAASAGQGVILTASQKLAAEKSEIERRKALHKHDMEHIMTSPFRQMGRGLAQAGRAVGKMGSGFVRGIKRDGFVGIKVNGQKCRIDVTGGFILDHGRALDRLVKVAPDGKL